MSRLWSGDDQYSLGTEHMRTYPVVQLLQRCILQEM